MISLNAGLKPDAPAITATGLMMTYAELDRRANQLANRLVELGVGRETQVALCLGRSAESVASSLGVLKTGGAYLPLDPAYPAERLSFMLNDARPQVLITDSRLANSPVDGPWAVIDLARDQEIDRSPETPPAVEITRDQLAYVIYTSGSTGRPKVSKSRFHACAREGPAPSHSGNP
jgi:non-ribosomal peptide synthetase component F